MKRIMSILLALCLLCSLFPTVATAAEPTKQIPDVTAYSYTVTPILSPFTYFLYVQTDNPDPTSFRLVDKECRYYTEDSYGEIRLQKTATSYSFSKVDPGTYYFSPYIYPDVVYEDESTYRVKGGYIFRADGSYSDGGEFVLLQKTYNGSSFIKDKFEETDVTVSCDRLYDKYDYLITHCTTEEMTFFEKLSAVQSFLDENAVYPRSVYDSSKPVEGRSHPFLAVSPYVELGLNEHYDFCESIWSGLLTAKVFPFVLDSLGFPGTIMQVARQLEPSCTTSSGSTHWRVTVTFDGTSKTYGGAGAGGYDPLYTERVQKSFTFQGGTADLGTNGTIDAYYALLRGYETPAVEDAEKYRDLIAGDTFYKTIAATGGTWIRVATEGGFGYGTAIGYALPIDGKTRILSDAWVDGRYVGKHEAVEPGEKQEDHPTASIVLHDFTYTDINGVEHTQDVCFRYMSINDTWNATEFYYGGYAMLNSPEELILSRAEVEAMDLDYNTNYWPTEGLIYDGTEYPGTPFTHKSVEKVTIPETLTLRVDERHRVNIVVEPADAFDTRVTLTSSDASVVEVPNSLNGDYIRGVREGTAVITATSKDGSLQSNCTVTVLPALCETHSFGAYQIEKEPTLDSEGAYCRKCSVCFLEESGVLPALNETDYAVTVTKEATCTETGVREYAWKGAQGEFPTFSVSIALAEHKYEAVITAPTCLEEGYTTHTCSVCGDAYTDGYLPAKGHGYSLKDVVEPTFEETGILTIICLGCMDTQQLELPVLSSEDYIVKQSSAPTCTEEGLMEYRWKNETYGPIIFLRSIATTEHTYILEKTVAPSCLTDGYELWRCTGCTAQYQANIVSAYGSHAWDDGVVTAHPTCTEAGELTYTCTRCGETETETIDATGHSFAISVVEPTCTENGYTVSVCGCGLRITTDEVEALGHDWNEGTATKEPTCTESGETAYACNRCGETKTEIIEALGHSYEASITEPTCTEQGYTTYTCFCGESYTEQFADALGHEWDNGTVTKEVTCFENGEMTYTCTRCTEQYTQEIATTGHVWDEGTLIKEPTQSTDGLMLYTCLRCNETRSEIIDAYGKEPCDGGAHCPSCNTFTDAPPAGHWAHEGIDYAIRNGLFNGMSETTFEPDTTMTRAMLVTVLWRYCLSPEIGGANPFSDVADGQWYSEAIRWAAFHGIVNGVAEGVFDPNGTITRQQLATILYRFSMANSFDTTARADLSVYPDGEKVSTWAADALSWAVAEGLINGVQNGTQNNLEPLGSATRAQVATILMRYIENVVNEA